MKHTISTTHDHTTGRDLFVVLTPDGFDALGEGFETAGEALRAALCLDTEKETETLTTAPLPKLGDIIEMPHTNAGFLVAEMWADSERVRAVLHRVNSKGQPNKTGEIETLYYYSGTNKGLKLWNPCN
jgi:hypothetical protein